MPGFLLHVGATVVCAHGGQAQPTAPNSRVMVGGMPAVTLTTPYVVTGCLLPPPLARNGPCVTGRWITAATRVTSDGHPLLLADSQAVCAPTGTPLLILAMQTRVSAV